LKENLLNGSGNSEITKLPTYTNYTRFLNSPNLAVTLINLIKKNFKADLKVQNKFVFYTEVLHLQIKTASMCTFSTLTTAVMPTVISIDIPRSCDKYILRKF